MGPGDLAQILAPLRQYLVDAKDERLLVGLAVADDAAVYRLSDEQALIQTVDFFTPIVDDPRAYGAIAAANAMSDVYAMGGEVLLALNIGAFPDDLPREMIGEIMVGAAERLRAAGALVAGGHTVVDREPKFGLVVTGTIHPERIVTLAGARPGDQLVLTKPLGTGIIATAARADKLAEEAHLTAAVDSMAELNRGAARAMQRVGVHAATDVTGFGLLGHAAEMAEASGVGMRLDSSKIPLLAGATHYAAAGHTTAGGARNRAYFTRVTVEPSIPEALAALCWDPQTSGGLLIAVPLERTDELLVALEEEGVSGHPIGEVEDGTELRLVTDPAAVG